MDRLHAHVKHVAECFNDASLQQSVATLRLFDYVEQIARWGVLNSPENTVYFLKYCLNIDRKLQVGVGLGLAVDLDLPLIAHRLMCVLYCNRYQPKKC